MMVSYTHLTWRTGRLLDIHSNAFWGPYADWSGNQQQSQTVWSSQPMTWVVPDQSQQPPAPAPAPSQPVWSSNNQAQAPAPQQQAAWSDAGNQQQPTPAPAPQDWQQPAAQQSWSAQSSSTPTPNNTPSTQAPSKKPTCRVGKTRSLDDDREYEECVFNTRGGTEWKVRQCPAGTLFNTITGNCGDHDPDYEPPVSQGGGEH